MSDTIPELDKVSKSFGPVNVIRQVSVSIRPGKVQALLGENGAGSEIFVVGFDGMDDGLRAIEDDRMVATIAQQPAELGAQAVEQAAKLLNDESADEEVPVEAVTVTVTRDNVGDFL